jgi:UDPglucose 6-dehydrogenase
MPMKVGVLGLYHLGSVTAACLASLGHRVVAVDFDPLKVANLNEGVAPIFEPGLQELIQQGLASGNLRFSSAIQDAADVDVLWAAYDTPVDDHDRADAEFVLAQIERALLALSADVLVLVSSQLPVGSVRRLEQAAAVTGASNGEGRQLRLAYSPENLRLGSALSDFLHSNRIVVGVRTSRDRELLHGLLGPMTESIEWMSVESAEMAKHAINAFLAASVAFANEIATLCESVGADAKEVERALKSESRIGPRAYLSPGAAFAGGTLARDVAFLDRMGRERGVATPLLSSVLPSNDSHKHWARRTLRALFMDLSRVTVAVWGLTYKPGTDTLRGSLSVDLCEWLIREGAAVRVHDPLVKTLPRHWCDAVVNCDDPLDAVLGADALIVGSEWPPYRTIAAQQLMQGVDRPAVLDPNRFLAPDAGAAGRLRYFAVGMPLEDR